METCNFKSFFKAANFIPGSCPIHIKERPMQRKKFESCKDVQVNVGDDFDWTNSGKTDCTITHCDPPLELKRYDVPCTRRKLVPTQSRVVTSIIVSVKKWALRRIRTSLSARAAFELTARSHWCDQAIIPGPCLGPEELRVRQSG